MDPRFDESSLLGSTPGHLNVPVSARTPTHYQRAFSHEPPSSRRSIHTPLQTLPRPPNSGHRGLSASGRRRNNAPTPHAKAAYKAIDQRRAAMTPGKRRQSLAPRRQSMIDPLRALSRALAPSSAIIKSSSPPEPGSTRPLRSVEEEDDELPIDRPNLTLPIDEDDDDYDLRPHRSSMLEGDLTAELPRRAYSEMPSRMSLGTTRMSDYYNLNDVDEPVDLTAPGFFPPLGMDDADFGGAPMDDDTYERIDDDARRESGPPRESDFGFDVPLDADIDPSTFMMPLAQSSPMRPALSAEDDGQVEDAPPAEDQWPDLLEQPSDLEGDVEEGVQDDEVDPNATAIEGQLSDEPRRKRKLKPGWRMSKQGNQYPQFPPATVKRVAEQFAKTSGIPNPRISKDTLAAFQQATDWFYEQVSEDLAAYATHAGRKTINESDMELVMKRQRQITSTSTIFSLATQYLPQELVRELRMPPPVIRKGRRKANRADQDGGEEN